MIKILRENNKLKQIPLDCIKGATLLSEEEAENLLTKEERMCRGTRQAINSGLAVADNGNSYYWLRSGGRQGYEACSVLYDGGFYCYWTYISSIGIRPALILNLQSSNFGVGDMFKFSNYTFKVISNNLAICDVIVGTCPFNLNKEDGNDYETSYIRDKVDSWFDEAYKYEEEQRVYEEAGIDTDDDIFGVWANW